MSGSVSAKVVLIGATGTQEGMTKSMACNGEQQNAIQIHNGSRWVMI